MDKALQILREYIDERIAFVTDDPEWRNKEESERLWEKFIQFIAAHLQSWEMRRAWISIKQRLPETGKLVLVYWERHPDKILTGKLTGLNGPWSIGNSLTQNVTFWMPLPGPPPEGWGECGEVEDA